MDNQKESKTSSSVQYELRAMREKCSVIAQELIEVKKELMRLELASVSESMPQESEAIASGCPAFVNKNAPVYYLDSNGNENVGTSPTAADSSSGTKAEEQSCTDCLGWDWTAGDCTRRYCIFNKHKYGEVPGASDLWPNG